MKQIILILIGLLVLSTSNAQDFSKQLENNNRFTFELYKYLNVTSDNLFISPFSVTSALAMTYEGAQGTTKDQMAKYLHYPADKKENLKNFYDILLSVQSKEDDTKYIMNIANSLWAQKDFKFVLAYFDNIRAYFNAPVVPVDFKDEKNREEARLKINDWTAKKTNDKIKDILNENALSDRTRLVLVNAVYFFSQWKNEFDKKQTKNDVFFALDGMTKKDYMSSSSELRYAEGEGVKLVEIPYSDDKASMIILLPEKKRFNEFQKKLDYAVFNTLYQTAYSVKVNLSIPKFKIEYKEDLAKTFSEAGMDLPFTDGADFSDMAIDNNLRIDKIIHQTFINVDESGTEAAASTAVIMNTKSGGVEKVVDFNANSPFIFLIKENATGSIIFLGQLVK
jgi:serpin B